MTENKNHWYDGWFYDKVIAPNQDRLFGEIKSLVPAGSKVIDVGCGTGRLAFALTDKCSSVLGIDLSKVNIDRASYNLNKSPDEHISFRHSDLSEIVSEKSSKFDYSVLTYVIHEVDRNERIALLKNIAEVSDRIILGDYLYPKQSGFGGFFSTVIEFIAGREHFRNYKSYMADGGIHYLAEKAGLRIIEEKRFDSYNNHIVILKR